MVLNNYKLYRPIKWVKSKTDSNDFLNFRRDPCRLSRKEIRSLFNFRTTPRDVPSRGTEGNRLIRQGESLKERERRSGTKNDVTQYDMAHNAIPHDTTVGDATRQNTTRCMTRRYTTRDTTRQNAIPCSTGRDGTREKSKTCGVTGSITRIAFFFMDTEERQKFHRSF